MCNFYIMYYMEHQHVVPFMNCMEAGDQELFQNIPAEANVPIPVAAGHLHSPGHMGPPAGSLRDLHMAVYSSVYKLAACLLSLIVPPTFFQRVNISSTATRHLTVGSSVLQINE